jgi:hypothetical protein
LQSASQERELEAAELAADTVVAFSDDAGVIVASAACAR